MARRAAAERGATTAAMVILFPLFVLMVMALVQWGLYFHATNQVSAAAQDATRAAQGVDGTVEDGQQVAADLLAASMSSGLLHAVDIKVTRSGGVVRTQVDATVRALVPLPGPLRVQGVSGGPAEIFRTPQERGA